MEDSYKSKVISQKLIILIMLVCLAALIGCAKREIKNINSQGINIICYGESITYGYGVNPADAYPLALAKMTSIPVINAGIDGDTSSEALKRIDNDVLDREPLLVVIQFAGNDFLRKVPKEITIENVRQMIEKIQARGAMVAIVDISVGGVLFKDYYLAFDELSRRYGAIFIPHVLNGIVTNSRLKSDFMHPNADGYKIIAHRVFREILPYLNQNTILKAVKKD